MCFVINSNCLLGSARYLYKNTPCLIGEINEDMFLDSTLCVIEILIDIGVVHSCVLVCILCSFEYVVVDK